jgi:hypothetical protein
MRKTSTLPAVAGETDAAMSDGKIEFRIKPGVPWINGRRVRDAKTVRLTAEEAAYDLGLSRLSPADQPVPADWPADVAPVGNGDGGN